MNYNVHDILNIKAGLAGIIPEAFLSEQRTGADIEIQEARIIEFEDRFAAREISPGIFVLEKEKKIIARFRIFGIKNSISLQFADNRIIIGYTPSYKFISDYILKMPVASLYPLEHFIKLIIQVKLLEKNFSYLISAGIVANDEAILISSFGGMGKTTTCLRLLKSNSEWKFLGDDTLITDGHKIFSYPKNLRIRKLGNPFLSYNQSISPKKYLQSKNEIASFAVPRKLFFLEKGNKNDVYKISPEEALIKYEAISRKILPISAERMLLSAFHQNLINLPELAVIQDAILEKLISQLDCFVVESKDVFKFSKLISDKVNKK